MDLFNTTDFDAHVKDLLDEWHVPCISIALFQDDNIKSKSYGKKSLDSDELCTSDTLYDIASTSKSLTAASIALLCEDKRYPEVQWNAKMCKLLPDDFVMAEERYTSDVTVEDILSHRTGLPGYELRYRRTV
jgi:CubicO group peptidase (beta-lactamase class C family)